MNLTGLHLLLSYQCTLECDHCFAWGSPSQTGTMSPEDIDLILEQAGEMGGIPWIYFEGGEPFLYYAVLLKAVRAAARQGFRVGIVTNGYWANSAASCLENLRPFAGLLQDLTISSDPLHWGAEYRRRAGYIEQAAQELGLPLGEIAIAEPTAPDACSSAGMLAPGEDAILYRGRAAVRLAAGRPGKNWEAFTTCPHEDLREPGRVHLDPLGYVHICQGITLGNIHGARLAEICDHYQPEAHPVCGPLLAGGPAELVRRYNLPLAGALADACHLCYTARSLLRTRFPEALGPGQMYGEYVAVSPGS